MIRAGARLLAGLILLASTVSAQRGAPIPAHLSFAPYHASGIF
jgi:hypothetical protein